MPDAQIPSPEPARKYWWAAAIVVPILVAIIGVVGQQHKQDVVTDKPPIVTPFEPPSAPSTIVWVLPIVGFVLGGAVVAAVTFFTGDVLPAPVLFLFAMFGAGFAIWAAVATNSDSPGRPLPVMILLAVSGISLLGFGIACAFRELQLGAYVGCCAAVAAGIFLIIWEIGSSGTWVTEGGGISTEPGPFHLGYAIAVTLGVILSARNIFAWLSLVLAALSFLWTAVWEFSTSDTAEMTALGLGVFLVAMIMVYFALASEDVDDLPDWVPVCLIHLKNLGGLALIALSLFGFAKNGPEGVLNGTALGLGVVAILVAASTESGLRRRRRF